VVAVLAAGAFSVGLGVVYLIIVRATILQRTVDRQMFGSVGGVMRFIEWGPGPFGGLLGGLLGHAIGLRPALFVVGAGCFLGVPWIAVAAVRGRLDPARER
jgi:hypothetical protein